MSDGFIRHLIALIGTLVCGFVFWAAYHSGANGWWWTSFGLVVLYGIIFSLVEA